MLTVESKIGPMSLVYVKTVRKRTENVTTTVYEVLLDGGARIAATALHAFVVIRDGITVLVAASDLRKGDKVWLDSQMWAADGSLLFEGPWKRKLTP